MTTWHPPIPAEAVYQPEVAELGAGIRLFLFCYNCVERDGTFVLSLKDATTALSVKYETLRKWWQGLRESGIVTVLSDRGRSGFHVQFNDGWIDWHVHEKNFSTQIERENKNVENRLKEVERSNFTAENIQPSLNGSSIDFERENTTVETSGNKVLMSDQESESTSECVNHDNAHGTHTHENGTGPGEPSKSLSPLALAILEACQFDPDLVEDLSSNLRDQLNSTYTRLKGLGATPADVQKRVDYWYEKDWRPRKEKMRPPTPKELIDIWRKAVTPSRAPPKPESNGRPTENRPPLQPFQPQSHPRTDPAKFRAIAEDVVRKKANNGDTS